MYSTLSSLLSNTVRGNLNLALPAAPSAVPEVVEPQKELVAPSDVCTMRILLLTLSATYIIESSEVSARAQGALNEALAAAPSSEAAEPSPASVVTAPFAVATFRIRWPPKSETYR